MKLQGRGAGLFGFLVAAALLFPGGMCRALQFDVFVGYGGVVKEADWFPVTCEIMNDGAAFRGLIEISGTHFGTRQKRQLALELPSNTRKRVVIPVFHAMAGLASWDGRLYDESGKLIAEQPGVRVKEVAWEGVIMGSMSRTFAGAPKFPSFRDAESTMQPQIGRLTAEQFPDNPIALEGLSSLYMNSEQALKLTAPQIGALTSWIAAGGHLIVAIEQPADVVSTDWLQALSPFIPESVSQVTVGSAFYQWLLDDAPESVPPIGAATVHRNLVAGTPAGRLMLESFAYSQAPRELSLETSEIPLVTGRQRDGEVLLEAGGVPLVISAVRGRGAVTALTFSPEREPFRSWKSKTWFWAKLNRIPVDWFEAPRFNNWGGESVDGIFGSLIESRQVRKLPVRWLLALLVVYLIVIGPFDHWFLKRINRQMLTWITFPAYVVVFSLLIYFIGYKLRSGESEWNEFHIVDLVQGRDSASIRGRSYASIYSPVGKNYDVSCQVPGSLLRSEFTGSSGGGQELGEATIQYGASGALAEVFVPVWSSQLYAADWSKQGAQPFRATASITGGSLNLKLENLGTHGAESIGVIAEGRFFEVDGLTAGGTRTESLDLRLGVSLRNHVQQKAQRYPSVLGSRRQTLGETVRLNDLSGDSMVSSFLADYQSRGNDYRGFIYPHGMDLSALVDRGEVIVLFYCPGYSPIAPLNNFEVARSKRGSLVRLAITPDDGAGEL